jgi:hypothetical protein
MEGGEMKVRLLTSEPATGLFVVSRLFGDKQVRR